MLSFHTEVAEVAISSHVPFKKASQELAVLPRNPHPLLRQTLPPFLTSAVEKPISNSNDMDAGDENSSQIWPQAMEEELQT